EGFELFREMLGRIKENTIRALCHLRIETEVREDEFQHKESKSDLEYSDSENTETKKSPNAAANPKWDVMIPAPAV
ncbi:preprotein translocase subunit SecA, partial [Aduncisulcus paluster]